MNMVHIKMVNRKTKNADQINGAVLCLYAHEMGGAVRVADADPT